MAFGTQMQWESRKPNKSRPIFSLPFPIFQEIDLEENPIRSEIVDQIEAQIQFQVVIRVSEPKDLNMEDMDWYLDR